MIEIKKKKIAPHTKAGTKRKHPSKEKLHIQQGTADSQIIHVLESMGDGFFMLDRDWKIVMVNRVHERITKTKRENIIGKDFWTTYPGVGDPKSQYYINYQKVMHTREPASFTEYYPPLNLWTEVDVYPTQDGGISVFFRDVSIRKRAEEKVKRSEERYRTLFNSIDEGFCVIEVLFDKKNKPFDYMFLETNTTFKKQTGLKNAIGKTALELVPGLEKHWFEIYGKVAITGKPSRFTSGSEAMGKWFEVHASRVGDKNSRKVGLLFTDITKRKQAKDSLIESEERFRIMADAAPHMVWALNPDGTLKYINTYALKFLGTTFDDFVKQNWAPFIHPDDMSATHQAIAQAMQQKKPYSQELRLRRKDGAYRWILSQGAPSFFPNGEMYGYVGSVIDIHDRKINENALKKNEEALLRFKYMADNATEAFILMRKDGSFAYLNDLALERWGYTRKEAKMLRVPDVDPIYQKEKFTKAFASAQKGKLPQIETIHKRKDGSTYPVEVSMGGVTIHDIAYMFAIARDVSERKIFEENLLESEERFRTMAEGSEILIAVADEKSNATYFNKAWADLTGRPMKDLLNLGWADLIHPDDRQTFVDIYLRALERKEAFSGEFRILNSKNEYSWLLAKGPARFHPNGTFAGHISSCIDITDRKMSEEALTESEELFRTLADQSPMVVFMANADGTVTYWNKYWLEFTGKTLDEALGLDWQKINHPDDLKKLLNVYLTATKARENYTIETRFKRHDGVYCTFLFTAGPRYLTNGEFAGYVGVGVDITERKQLEQQKDNFLGIASHELKTPVTSIKAYGQALEAMFRRKGDANAADKLAKMDVQINKLGNLIEDLLDVTKMQTGKMQFHQNYFDFNELVIEVTEEIQRTVEKHHIVIQLAKSKSVYGDRERIGQVLSNLITNAIKYSPNATEVFVTTHVDKKNVTLCVKDFGVGIPEKKQSHVFEQFFRVSGPKQDTFPGLGLGLYISSEIIKRENGRIWVESSEGKGSTFCFCLPIKKPTSGVS